MRTSDSIAALAPALLAAQRVMQHPPKNATNPHLRNKFADLKVSIDTAREALTSADIAIVQSVGGGDGSVSVTTRLLHSSGEWIEDTVNLALEPQKGLNAPQVAGVAITYLRRYGLNAICCVVGDPDNDGSESKTEAQGQGQREAAPAGEDRGGSSRPAPAPPVDPPGAGVEFPYREPDGLFMRQQLGSACKATGCEERWPCDDHPLCPCCGGQMWDARAEDDGGKGKYPKKNAKAPDYKCRSKDCCASHEDAGQKALYWAGQWQSAAQAARDAHWCGVQDAAVSEADKADQAFADQVNGPDAELPF